MATRIFPGLTAICYLMGFDEEVGDDIVGATEHIGNGEVVIVPVQMEQ